jgi:hypothetical protein
MYLCQLDGKLYDDKIYHDIVLKNKKKEIKCKVCSFCWGQLNVKYCLGKVNDVYVIPDDVSHKIYNITSKNFEYKPDKIDDKTDKVLKDILKTSRKKYKDLLS